MQDKYSYIQTMNGIINTFLIFHYLYMREPWVNLKHTTVSSTAHSDLLYKYYVDIYTV